MILSLLKTSESYTLYICSELPSDMHYCHPIAVYGT